MFGLVSIAAGATRTGLVCLVVTAIGVWFSRAHYTVTSETIVVRVGWGFPHISLTSAEIAEASTSSLPALLVGGWGYRGCWTFFHRVAISLGGSGVLVKTNTGGRLQLSTHHQRDLLDAIVSMAPHARN